MESFTGVWQNRTAMPIANRLKLPSAPVRAQVESREAWNAGRHPESADFFTVGYTGRKLPELLDALVAAGVRSVVDVRHNPVSMYRPELSKRNLCAAVEARGLTYHHAPNLGVPRDIRSLAIDAGSRDPIWAWYDEFVVAPTVGRNLHWFFNAIEHPTALLCVEIDPTECHRHRLCLALEEHGLKGFDL